MSVNRFNSFEEITFNGTKRTVKSFNYGKYVIILKLIKEKIAKGETPWVEIFSNDHNGSIGTASLSNDGHSIVVNFDKNRRQKLNAYIHISYLENYTGPIKYTKSVKKVVRKIPKDKLGREITVGMVGFASAYLYTSASLIFCKVVKIHTNGNITVSVIPLNENQKPINSTLKESTNFIIHDETLTNELLVAKLKA